MHTHTHIHTPNMSEMPLAALDTNILHLDFLKSKVTDY